MTDFTDQQIEEAAAVEEKYGSYGNLVHGTDDAELTPFQKEYCQRVFDIHHDMMGAQLAREHGGESYPLGALAERIDAEIEKHTPQRQQ